MAKAKQNSSPFSLLFLLLFAILPIVYATTLGDKTLVPRQLFASVAMLVILLLAWSRKRASETFALPAGLAFFAGFLLIGFISVTAAINPVESWAVLSRYVLFFCYLAIVVHLLHTKMLTALQLITAIILFGAIAALITIFNILGVISSGDFVRDIYTVSGTFSHKNLLSSALMLSFPFAVMGAVVLGRRGWRRTALVLALILVVEMFVLRTRGVWLSMFVGALVAVPALLAVRRKTEFPIKLPFKWIGIGAGAALVLVFSVLTSQGTESLTNPTNLDRRIAFWQNSLKMIQENPLIGVGPGNWKINFPKYGLSTIEQIESGYTLGPSVYQGITQIQRPHNDYLWVWSESGPLGLLLYLGIFISAIWSLVRNMKDFKTKEELAIDIAALFGIVAYMTFSLTDFPIERTAHAVLLMSLLALSFRHTDTRKAAIPLKAFFPVLLVGLGFSAFVSWYRWQGEQSAMKVLEANEQRNPAAIVPAVEEAMNPFYNMDGFANPLPYYSSLGKLFMEDAEGALRDARAAIDIHPYSIISLNQMGNVLKHQGKLDEALKYYHRATDISIRYEAAQLNKAEIYMKQNKPADAFAALVFVSTRSQHPKYRTLLGRALPALVAQYPEHGRYRRVVEYFRNRNPQSRGEFIDYYIRMRVEGL